MERRAAVRRRGVRLCLVRYLASVLSVSTFSENSWRMLDQARKVPWFSLVWRVESERTVRAEREEKVGQVVQRETWREESWAR